MRFDLQVFFGQHKLERSNVMRQKNLNPVKVKSEEVWRVVQDAGERFFDLFIFLADLQPLLQSHVETSKINWQNFFAGFLGTENPA